MTFWISMYWTGRTRVAISQRGERRYHRDAGDTGARLLVDTLPMGVGARTGVGGGSRIADAGSAASGGVGTTALVSEVSHPRTVGDGAEATTALGNGDAFTFTARK